MSNEEKKITAIMVLGDVEINITGIPGEVKECISKYISGDLIQQAMIDEVDYAVNNQTLMGK